MKIDIKFIALLAIICLLSLSVVSAADDAQTDVTADANDDIEIGDADTATNDDASSTPKTTTDLKNLITSASDGDTIELDSDFETGTVVKIDKKITIDGKDHTIDGKTTDRIFTVWSSDVTLKNIVFKNGKAIQLDGKADSGGAIVVMSSKGGSAITIINCTFKNNVATDNGGAFYCAIGGHTFRNCTFEDNIAAKSGGAININGNGNTIENCIFKNNYAAERNGGAITITSDPKTTSTNIIKGSYFENNQAQGKTFADGGAIYISNGTNDQITNNEFIKNSGINGGAISLYDAGHSTITNNTFTSNSVSIKSAKSSVGGAIRLSINNPKSKTIISENTFKSNSAPTSGAIHIDGNNIEISKNVFDNNKAKTTFGGSIGATSNTISILNNNITNTNAKTLGGAIYVKGNPVTIKANEINNANAADGGAIYVDKTSVATINSNNFTKCTASNFGGAIRAESKVIVTKNIFTDNTATKGSDIRIYNGDGSQVKNNNFVTYTANSIVTYGNVAIQDNKGFKEVLSISTLNKNYAVTTTTKYLTVVLKNSKGTGVAGKNITITLNGKDYTGVTNAKGQYKTKITISAVKKYPCTVNFAGDDSNTAAKLTFTIAVNKAATKITSPAKTFKKSKTKKVVLTLKSGKKALAKKKVSIKINKKTYYGTTNKYGKVTIKIKLTKKGTYKGTLKYVGNKTYKACTGKVTIKVK